MCLAQHNRSTNYFLPITLSTINDSFSSHHAKYHQLGYIVKRLETNHIQKCANIRMFKKQGISSLISRTVQFMSHAAGSNPLCYKAALGICISTLSIWNEFISWFRLNITNPMIHLDNKIWTFKVRLDITYFAKNWKLKTL